MRGRISACASSEPATHHVATFSSKLLSVTLSAQTLTLALWLGTSQVTDTMLRRMDGSFWTGNGKKTVCPKIALALIIFLI